MSKLAFILAIVPCFSTVLVGCGNEPSSGCPEGDIECGSWPEEWAAFEEDVLDAVNAVRASGATCDGVPQPPVPPLERNVHLTQAARLHSLDMVEQDYLEHTSRDGRMMADRMAEAGFTGGFPIGENIAADYFTASDVMAGWMSSPGHCLNIMEPSYRVLGVGYAEARGETRWTQNFGASH
jgi:uncharacterized protein YkwD